MPVMPEAIRAIPFNMKAMESRKTRVRKPSAGYKKTTTDTMIVKSPIITSKPLSQPGKASPNPPTTTLAIPLSNKAKESR